MIEFQTEAAIVGYLVNNPEQTPELKALVKPDDFKHLAVRKTIIDIFRRYEANQPIDVILLSETSGVDLATLADICQSACASLPGCRRYVKTLKDRYLRASIKSSLQSFSEQLDDLTNPLDETTSNLISELINWTQTEKERGQFKHISKYLQESAEQLEKRINNGGGIQGLKTGIDSLDERTGGFSPGDLIVIAGRPGSGKTALACNMLDNVSKETHCLNFSLEMPGQQLSDRMIAAKGTDLKAIKTGQMDNAAWHTYLTGIAELKERKLHICDDYKMTIHDVRVAALRKKAEFGAIGLISIDHIGLLSKTHQGQTDRERISEITRDLKNLAKEIGCPIIALSQLNRECESRNDKRPRLSDLKNSGSIEEDADTIIFAYRDKYYDEESHWGNVAELISAKVRHGEPGTDYTVWQGEYQRFMPVEPAEVHRIQQMQQESSNSKFFNG